jgi:hypothetical protein
MSAYIVPRAHIAALVRAAYRGPNSGRPVNPDTVWRRPTWFASDPRALEWDHATPGAYFAALSEIRREVDHESIPKVAQMLLDANVASVSHRYPDDKPDELPGPIDAYYVRPVGWQAAESNAPSLAPVAVLKALDGYEYQACERDDWPDSEARAFCDALRGAVIHHLPGYDDAAWEIDDETPAQVVGL